MLIFSGKIDEYKNFERTQFIERNIEEQKIAERKQLEDDYERFYQDYLKAKEGRARERETGLGPSYQRELQKELDSQNRLELISKQLESKRKEQELKENVYSEKAEKEWKKHEDFFDLSTDLAILYKVTATIDELDKIAKRENKKHSIVQTSKVVKSDEVSSTNEEPQLSIDKAQNTSVTPAVAPQKEEPVINPALPKDDMMHNCRIFITFFFVLLEVIPVLTKLFFKAGDYDKEMVRWSYLKAKLHRIENANSYNQTINGALSTHRKYILGDEFEDIAKALQSDENHENDNSDDIDNITLPIKGCLRTAQDYNDWRNLRRWKFAIMKADDYLEEEINKLFPQMASTHKPSQPVQPQQQPLSTPVDPSAGGETID